MARRIDLQPDFHSIDGGQPGGLGCLPESGDPVEPIMIGYGERLVAELDGPLHQIFGM